MTIDDLSKEVSIDDVLKKVDKMVALISRFLFNEYSESARFRQHSKK